PLASSGFVNFLYQKCQSKFTEEQRYPRIILISDPTIPDRMQCAKKSDVRPIAAILDNKVQELLYLGVSQILICCFTAHYFLPWLTLQSQKKILHLGQLLSKYIEKRGEKTLILSSELSMTSHLINSPFAIYPAEKYFNDIHKL